MNNSIDIKSLIEINSIIERDSKDSTYKFALLRGIIDIIIEYPQLITKFENDDKVKLPFGLLIFNWIFYYYPIFSSSFFIPQKNGETQTSNKLAIRKYFNPIIEHFERNGGIQKFYNDFKKNDIPTDLRKPLLILIKEIASVIKKMPMKYLGQSYFAKYYDDAYNKVAYFNNDGQNIPNNFEFKGFENINMFGTFTIPYRYFFVFENIGRYILGNSSLLSKWTNFTLKLRTIDNVKESTIYNLLLKSPVTERNVQMVKNILNKLRLENSILKCVWSGKQLTNYAVDHVIPFSIWPNNNLWNLLPSDSKINLMKLDKIPSENKLIKSKEEVLFYWNTYKEQYEHLFMQEIEYTLTGKILNKNNTLEICFEALIERCNYLINHGYEPWI